MTRMGTIKGLLCTLALGLGSAAGAQLVSSQHPGSVVKAMESEGWAATLVAPKDGNPYIESKRDGIKLLVLFMNCNDDRQDCRSLQFYMGFNDAKDTTLDRLNEWNRTKRFGRAYRDEEGDPVMEMDVDTDQGGISPALFGEYLKTWGSLMDQFHGHIYPAKGS